MCEEDVLVVETTVEKHGPEEAPEGETEARPWALLVATGAYIIGQHPFLETEHQLKLIPGATRTVWHDGAAWRVSTEWGPRYASRVLQWPALDGLDIHRQYALRAPLDCVEPMTLTPSEELR